MNLYRELYHDLQKALQRLGSDTDPSELHGTLSGLLCASNNVDLQTWLNSLFPQQEAGNLLVQDLKDYLAELYQHTQSQLNDPECGFELLLPDEDSEEQEQILALGEWCQGFAIGLNLGGVEDFRSLPGDAAEAVGDLLEIARAGTSYFLSGGEEDELARTELLEYVRIAVLLVNEELHPNKRGVVNSTTVH